MSTELLVGILLIGMGLLLGAAAYMVLSSRRDDPGDESLSENEEFGEIDEDEEDQIDLIDIEASEDGDSVDDDIPIIAQDRVSPPGDADPSDPADARSSDSMDATKSIKVADSEEEPQDQGGAELDTEMQTVSKPISGPRIQVAMLMRDEVSGRLIVKVGENEYQSADELRQSKDWTKVEFAANDLNRWIDKPEVRAPTEREIEVGDRTKPLSMIEQINEILQMKIEASGEDQLAVRLIEGAEGTARVLIGVHSYELGEVPEERINKLIRDAVADWEART